ncbi:hypothetical protein EMIT0158MI4_90318 [Burkholderia ambifaria]
MGAAGAGVRDPGAAAVPAGAHGADGRRSASHVRHAGTLLSLIPGHPFKGDSHEIFTPTFHYSDHRAGFRAGRGPSRGGGGGRSRAGIRCKRAGARLQDRRQPGRP